MSGYFEKIGNHLVRYSSNTVNIGSGGGSNSSSNDSDDDGHSVDKEEAAEKLQQSGIRLNKQQSLQGDTFLTGGRCAHRIWASMRQWCGRTKQFGEESVAV